MCFSAEVSFGASGILSVIGLLTLRKVKKGKLYPLAVIPLFFAIQQAFEGIVWVTFANPAQATLHTVAMYGFLFFAFFFWPVWIPFALLRIETHVTRRNILYGLLGAGIAIASGLVWSVFQLGVSAEVVCSHIKYAVEIPETFHQWGAWIYCLATILPFFVSSKKWAWFFGALLLGSVLLTLYAYTAYFTSVWCFFSAVLSMAIYMCI
jgi:hypothetical protein